MRGYDAAVRWRTAFYLLVAIGLVAAAFWLWWRQILIFVVAVVALVVLICVLTFPVALIYHLCRTGDFRGSLNAAVGNTKSAVVGILDGI